MTYVLPKRTHLVHKAVDAEKLSAKNKPVLDEVSGLPCVRDYVYERKYDGCCAIIVVDADLDVTFWSRDGKPCTSLAHLVADLQRLPARTVLFAEAWRAGKEFREISGAFRRKAVQKDLGIKVFDAITLDEFEEGYSNLPYTARQKQATKHVRRCTNAQICMAGVADWWEAAELAAREDEAYDGLVAKLRTGHWIAGAGLGGETIKIKNVVDVDLECVGLEEEHDKHGNPKGRLGAALFRFEGTTLGVYSGFNDDLRKTYWEHPEQAVGKIHRIVGMKASGKGSLREPRYKGARPDKDTPDY